MQLFLIDDCSLPIAAKHIPFYLNAIQAVKCQNKAPYLQYKRVQPEFLTDIIKELMQKTTANGNLAENSVPDAAKFLVRKQATERRGILQLFQSRNLLHISSRLDIAASRLAGIIEFATDVCNYGVRFCR